MMSNRPEHVAIWLGLGKLGVITALINTNLRLQSLIHCLRIAKVKSIIYMEEYSSGKSIIYDLSNYNKKGGEFKICQCSFNIYICLD